jgi:hypothetical protein
MLICTLYNNEKTNSRAYPAEESVVSKNNMFFWIPMLAGNPLTSSLNKHKTSQNHVQSIAKPNGHPKL